MYMCANKGFSSQATRSSHILPLPWVFDRRSVMQCFAFLLNTLTFTCIYPPLQGAQTLALR